MMTPAPLVVVGAGLAGWTTIREFRKLDTTTPVVLITQDSGDFYAKPSLSNAFAQKRTPAQLVTTPALTLAQTLQVALMTRTRVTGLDASSRTLQLQSETGADTVPATLIYDRLVLATGAAPIRVTVAGDAAGQILSVNSLDDFSRLFSALSPQQTSADSSENHSKRVAIMGAGLIGCEFANDLVTGGHHVHVVDPAARPLSALLPADASAALQTALELTGVQFHFNTTVAAVNHGTQGLAITLADGTTMNADVVLSAIGLRADVSLASAAGLTCERGVVVDTRLRTSDPHIYALGDNTQYDSASRRTLPYVMPIMQAAKVLAANLAGTPTELTFPLMPVSVKTPALPVAVSPPIPGLEGTWAAASEGAWVFKDADGVQRGFALAGAATSQRMAMAKATAG